MGKDDVSGLLKFLKPFPAEVQAKAWWLRDFVWKLYPKSNELIYDNYNALAFGWSPTEKLGHTFCSVAVGRTSLNVHFGFYWGSKIGDPEKKLIGNGNQYRYLLVGDVKEFPKTYLTKLIREAYAYSLSKLKDPAQLTEGKTIIKSISAVKRKKKRN